MENRTSPNVNETLKELSYCFEVEDRNKFMDCCYKIRDVSWGGLPALSDGAKSARIFCEKVNILSVLVRHSQQRQLILDLTSNSFLAASSKFQPDFILWTVCISFAMQYPRRDLRWSDVEMSNLVAGTQKLMSVVLPALENLLSVESGSKEKAALMWCHSVLLSVIRSAALFCHARGVTTLSEVWELHEIRITELDGELLPAGKMIHYLMKKQKCLRRAMVDGSRRAKTTVFTRPLLEILKTFVCPSNDSWLTIVRSQRKRHCIEKSFSMHCVFEDGLGDNDKCVVQPPAKRRLVDESRALDGKTSEDLIAISKAACNEKELANLSDSDCLQFVECLVLLQQRQQTLSKKQRNELLEKIVFTCKSSTPLLSKGGASGELHLGLLRLWSFLSQRKRLVHLLPNAHLYFTFLLLPKYDHLGVELFCDIVGELFSFLLHYLTLCRKRILYSPAVFLEAIRAAQAEVMRRADTSETTKPLASTDVSRLCASVLSLNKLIIRLCDGEHRNEMSRVVRLLLEDYFICAQSVVVHTEVKRCLLQIVFVLLDIIEPFCLEQMKLDLKVGPRELLKRVLIDFRSRKVKQTQK